MFFWRRKKKQDEAETAAEAQAQNVESTIEPSPDIQEPPLGDSEADIALSDQSAAPVATEATVVETIHTPEAVVDALPIKTEAPEPVPIPATPEEPEPEQKPELQPEPDTEQSQSEEEKEEAVSDEETEEAPRRSLFRKFVDRIKSTRDALVNRVVGVFKRHGKIDEELLEEIEEVLITGDVGVDTTLALIDDLRTAVKRQKKTGSSDINWLIDTLKHSIRERLDCGSRDLQWAKEGPTVVLVVGVNGTGKTTNIGKMGQRFKLAGQRVLMVAADTFRAAAIEQLTVWAERAGVDIVAGAEGADPSSVCYKAMEQIKEKEYDVILIDTAGRLHTKFNLMQELEKMGRVLGREIPGAPHEVLMVLDASTGQNAIQQAKTFTQAVNINGIILTKLDGTAKGGVTIAIHDQFHIPVKLVGVGEGIEDLEDFDPDAFTNALFEGAEQSEG